MGGSNIITMLQRGGKKLINAWAFYDWANSVYSLVISTAVFPIYYATVTKDDNGVVHFLGTDWYNTTLYSYALGFSFLIVALMSPILSSIADYTGNKKRFMQFFCAMGAVSVGMLFFFEGKDTLWVGIVFTILASIGFWSSLVFYNAYLPEIALPEQQDRVSARGFMYGYIGSVLLLGFNLSMVMKPELYGISEGTLPSRISFAMVAVWWLGFAQFTFKRLPNNVYHKKPEKDYIFKGFKALNGIVSDIKKQYELKIFLISFFVYSIGVQSVILLASIYFSKDLNLETSDLIITILIMQLVGIVGAYSFSRLSDRIGNIKSLKITIVVWAVSCFAGYLLEKEDPSLLLKVYALGGLLGLVLGAIQSLSRSTYSKLLPESTESHATYFSFFDVTEKVAIVMGMVISGIVTSYTNSLKLFILILGGFFIGGFIILSFMNRTKYVK